MSNAHKWRTCVDGDITPASQCQSRSCVTTSRVVCKGALRPFCRPKFWSCVNLLSFQWEWLVKTSLEVKWLEIDFFTGWQCLFIPIFFFFFFFLLEKNYVSKCLMCDLSHILSDTATAPGRARHLLDPYCVAGPSPLVMIGVTMESAATVIRQ